MNVIGNNIANVNTYGFKASRVTFSDVFYQTMNSASAPTDTGGGVNPTQLGYGAKVSSIDVINTRAGRATTGRALDVFINGEGYLPVESDDGTYRYTRVGVLSFDLNGSLIDTNGNKVCGFVLEDDGKVPVDAATKVPTEQEPKG
ncbi:MAG: flagellar hook-basal body complex protein, partial [Clostridia bacterium]|nr:flagellar hook-basal body complex protein [Clostridia bacterium]